MILLINSAGSIILLNNGFKNKLNAISQLFPFKEAIIILIYCLFFYFSTPDSKKILLLAALSNHTYFRCFMQPCHVKRNEDNSKKNCIILFRRRKGETYPCKCPEGRRSSDFLKLLQMFFPLQAPPSRYDKKEQK